MRPSQSRPYLFASRLLLVLAAVLLAVTPLTEALLDFDHFLRGGQDFELGLFALLATCCLVLLLAHLCRELWRQIVARNLTLRSPHQPPHPGRQSGVTAVAALRLRSGSLPLCFPAPLQI